MRNWAAALRKRMYYSAEREVQEGQRYWSGYMDKAERQATREAAHLRDSVVWERGAISRIESSRLSWSTVSVCQYGCGSSGSLSARTTTASWDRWRREIVCERED